MSRPTNSTGRAVAMATAIERIAIEMNLTILICFDRDMLKLDERMFVDGKDCDAFCVRVCAEWY